jgi:hypothetical protein
MVFEVTNESCFQKCDWTENNPGVYKAVPPPDAPELRGQSVSLIYFLDADRTGCCVTQPLFYLSLDLCELSTHPLVFETTEC